MNTTENVPALLQVTPDPQVQYCEQVIANLEPALREEVIEGSRRLMKVVLDRQHAGHLMLAYVGALVGAGITVFPHPEEAAQPTNIIQLPKGKIVSPRGTVL